MAEKVIEIPEIKLQKLTVTLQGQTPLITHRFGEKSRESMEGATMGKPKQKTLRDPEAEFRDALYVIKKGKYGFPAGGIKKSLVNAGGRFTDGQMTVLRGVINILGDLLEINGSEPQMRSDMVRLNGKTSMIAYRPMFFPWEIDVPVLFNAGMLTEGQVINLFQIAGFAVGIGDWRPEKNGTFGQFSIKEVKG